VHADERAGVSCGPSGESVVQIGERASSGESSGEPGPAEDAGPEDGAGAGKAGPDDGAGAKEVGPFGADTELAPAGARPLPEAGAEKAGCVPVDGAAAELAPVVDEPDGEEIPCLGSVATGDVGGTAVMSTI
jgi:hypothetical protein